MAYRNPRAIGVTCGVLIGSRHAYVEADFIPSTDPYWDPSIGTYLPGDPCDIDVASVLVEEEDGSKHEVPFDELTAEEQDAIDEAVCVAGSEYVSDRGEGW